MILCCFERSNCLVRVAYKNLAVIACSLSPFLSQYNRARTFGRPRSSAEFGFVFVTSKRSKRDWERPLVSPNSLVGSWDFPYISHAGLLDCDNPQYTGSDSVTTYSNQQGITGASNTAHLKKWWAAKCHHPGAIRRHSIPSLKAGWKLLPKFENWDDWGKLVEVHI